MKVESKREPLGPLLRAARLLITDPERWCECAAARDRHGVSVPPCSAGAVRWCAEGAAWAMRGGSRVTLRMLQLLNRVSQVQDVDATVFSVNDEKGHEAVLSMYDRAIEIAEEEGPVSAPTITEADLDILRGARGAILNFGNWCRRHAALDGDRRPVPARSIYATQWCAVGALRKAAGDSDASRVREIMNEVIQGMEWPGFDDWGTLMGLNDSIYMDGIEAHRKVLEAFDLAISLGEEQNRVLGLDVRDWAG